MKKIFRILISFALVMIIFYGCKDDDKTVIPDTKKGIKPSVAKNMDLDLIIDYYNINAAVIGISVDVYRGDPTSLEIIGQFNGGAPAKFKEVTTWPADIQLTTAELIATFPEIKSSDDLKVGDAFTFTVSSILKDGTKLPGVITVYKKGVVEYYTSYSVDVRTDVSEINKSVSVTYNVACGSDLGGNYLVTTTGFNTDGGCGVVDATVEDLEITLVDLGGGSYSVSDISGGMYSAWYSCYGGAEVAGTITDVCGSITVNGAGPFGASFYTTSGSYTDARVITIEWTNDFGDTATSVYTPK